MEHGTVTSSTYEEGVVYCSVQAIRVNTEYQDVPVLKSHSGFIEVPKQDETVAMDTLADGTRFITHVISREEGRPDDMREGELAIQLDDDTRVAFKKKNDGSHDLHLGSSGSIFINGEKFSEHTHEYEDATISDTGDGSGSESTETNETTPPTNG